MKYYWILDVLTDLRTFCEKNGLDGLAEELERTSSLARAELGSDAIGNSREDRVRDQIRDGDHS